MVVKNKKAISHLEMIISFTVFFIFVAFLLVYLNPLKYQNISNVLITAVEDGIAETSLLHLVEVPLTISSSVSGNCIEVPIESIFIEKNPQNFLVKDNFDRTAKFALTVMGDKINISIENMNSQLYYIYSSSEQISSDSSRLSDISDCFLPSQYEFTNPTIHDIYSQKKLKAIQDNYNRDYEGLKKAFNFPVSSDFSVNITEIATKTSIVSMNRAKSKGVEVKAIELPIEILKEEGTTTKAIMNIQVW